MSNLAEHLEQIAMQTIEIEGLERPLYEAGNLVVIRCTPEAKTALADIVTLATGYALRVKWLNEGTLVSIGLPTQKTKAHNGKEVVQQNTEVGEEVLCSSGEEGRQGGDRGSEETQLGADEQSGKKAVGDLPREEKNGIRGAIETSG